MVPLQQLYELTNTIEEATRYNQGTRRAEGIGTIPPMTQRPIVSKSNALSHSVRKPTPVLRPASQPTQHSRQMNVVWQTQDYACSPNELKTLHRGVVTYRDHP